MIILCTILTGVYHVSFCKINVYCVYNYTGIFVACMYIHTVSYYSHVHQLQYHNCFTFTDMYEHSICQFCMTVDVCINNSEVIQTLKILFSTSVYLYLHVTLMLHQIISLHRIHLLSCKMKDLDTT